MQHTGNEGFLLSFLPAILTLICKEMKRKEGERRRKKIIINLFHYRFINTKSISFSFSFLYIFILFIVPYGWITSLLLLLWLKSAWKVSYLYLNVLIFFSFFFLLVFDDFCREISQASSWVILLCRCGLPSLEIDFCCCLFCSMQRSIKNMIKGYFKERHWCSCC